MPIDYGYRDNVRFWFARHFRPYRVAIPRGKGSSFATVKYACQRFDPDIAWEDEACEKIVKVPNIFLKKALGGIVKAAREEGGSVITPGFIERVRDKRSPEKKK